MRLRGCQFDTTKSLKAAVISGVRDDSSTLHAYIASVMIAILLFEFLPYVEELLRGLRGPLQIGKKNRFHWNQMRLWRFASDGAGFRSAPRGCGPRRG